MLKKIRKLFAEKGQSIVEYALILGFVAVVTVGLFGSDGLKQTFRDTLTSIMGQFTRYNAAYSNNSSTTSDAGAGEGTDSGDGPDLDGDDNTSNEPPAYNDPDV